MDSLQQPPLTLPTMNSKLKSVKSELDKSRRLTDKQVVKAQELVHEGKLLVGNYEVGYVEPFIKMAMARKAGTQWVGEDQPLNNINESISGFISLARSVQRGTDTETLTRPFDECKADLDQHVKNMERDVTQELGSVVDIIKWMESHIRDKMAKGKYMNIL